jgi:hypothetical protein
VSLSSAEGITLEVGEFTCSFGCRQDAMGWWLQSGVTTVFSETLDTKFRREIEA